MKTPLPTARQADTLEITPGMIAAGVEALFNVVDPASCAEATVEDVFRAMLAAAGSSWRHRSPSQSG